MKSTKLTWHTERRRVLDLVPYRFNPRIITSKQQSDLQRSFKKFDYVELVAINFDGTLIAGHQRIQALIQLGRAEEKIEVRVPNRQLTEAEFKDYLITSNKSGGSFNFEILKEHFDIGTLTMAGFDAEEISSIFADTLAPLDSDTSDEEELAKIKKTSIKTGDVFILGKNKLVCGDSTDPDVVKKLMGTARAEMINIDPPFNISLSYNRGVGNRKNYGGTTDDSKTDDEYREFIRKLMQNSIAAAKPDAHLFFWCDERYVWLFQTLYKELGIDSKRLLIWLKDNASPTPTVAFNKVTEFCVYGTKGSPFLAKSVNNLNEIINPKMTTGNNLNAEVADEFNVWIQKRLASNQYNHPTEKSASIHTKALRRCTKVGDIVVDLTAGGGSILLACEGMKRVAYVCEKEPIFCQLIINKFQKLTGQKAKKV